MAELDADIKPEADREGDLPHPRDVFELFSHKTAEALLSRSMTSGRMHHAWMITGPKGVGKATLAYRLVRRVLGAEAVGDGLETSPDHPVSRQISALSHPDFLLVRRPYDMKKNKLKSEIPVDETRRVSSFFNQSASQDGWRVCMVDAADEMNNNAANALLKTLEEPPAQCLLILIAHVPGRLPVTIRSRCRKLVLRPPAVEETSEWLKNQHDIQSDMARQCAELALGAPGRALVLAQTGASEIKAKLDQLLNGLPALDRARTNTLATQLSGKGSEQMRGLALEFMVDFARAKAHNAAMANQMDVSRVWVQAKDDVARLVRDAETLYLDPKQTLIEAFAILKDSAGRSQA